MKNSEINNFCFNPENKRSEDDSLLLEKYIPLSELTTTLLSIYCLSPKYIGSNLLLSLILTRILVVP